jgi:FdrA protein
MVDPTVRSGLVRALGADPTVGLLLVDLVLGDGSHADPAPDLAAAVTAARAARGEAPLLVLCSITGSDADPQGLARQRAVLREAGIRVEPSASRAATAAVAVLRASGGR